MLKATVAFSLPAREPVASVSYSNLIQLLRVLSSVTSVRTLSVTVVRAFPGSKGDGRGVTSSTGLDFCACDALLVPFDVLAAGCSGAATGAGAGLPLCAGTMQQRQISL